jgi:hypothetical protein
MSGSFEDRTTAASTIAADQRERFDVHQARRRGRAGKAKFFRAVKLPA